MMQSSRYRRVAALTALSLLVPAYNPARATPLTDGLATQTGTDSRPVRPLSEAEIVDAGTLRPNDGLLGSAATDSVVQQYLGRTASDTGSAWARDKASSLDFGANIGSSSDMLRSMVNVSKGTPRNVSSRPGGVSDDGLLMGPEAREWIDETVRGIVNSVVDLKFNEQGRTSFAVLGMGDFGIMVSGDRNEVALVTGEDVLLTANRMSPAMQGGGARFQDTNPAANLPGGSATTMGDYSIHRLLETAQETVSHPLSLLVYAIALGFFVLWNILTAQSNRRPAATARGSSNHTAHRSFHRSYRSHRARRSRRS